MLLFLNKKTMQYVMITSSKVKFLLDEKEKTAVYQAVADGKKMVIIQGAMIPTNIAPTVIPYQTWAAQENERLFVYKKRLCRKCGSVMDLRSGCICWAKNDSKKRKDPFKGLELPPEVKNFIGSKCDLLN